MKKSTNKYDQNKAIQNAGNGAVEPCLVQRARKSSSPAHKIRHTWQALARCARDFNSNKDCWCNSNISIYNVCIQGNNCKISTFCLVVARRSSGKTQFPKNIPNRWEEEAKTDIWKYNISRLIKMRCKIYIFHMRPESWQKIQLFSVNFLPI